MAMKNFSIFFIGVLAILGCARVNMVAPKEAIKLDVSMRLDVYQHVAKDIDSIENQVSGSEKKTVSQNHQSLLEYFVSNAYAQDDLGAGIQAAVASRKDRRPELVAMEEKGVIGENASGLVEVRTGSAGQDLVQAENNDRLIIYKAVAEKNGTSFSDVQQLYAKRLQADAPSGTPVEGPSGWSIK